MKSRVRCCRMGRARRYATLPKEVRDQPVQKILEDA